MRTTGLCTSVLSALLLLGCHRDSSTSEAPDGGPALTYWQDIEPLLAQKCVRCHEANTVSKVRLDSLEAVQRFALAAALAAKSKAMPPFLVSADGSCGKFEDAWDMTAQERQKLWDWAMGSQAIGTPTARPAPPPKKVLEGAKEYKLSSFVPVAQGGELNKYDDYRCYVLDLGVQKDSFITGYEIVPGNIAILHHLGGAIVDPDKPSMVPGKTNGQVLDGLDAAGEGEGWRCFGLTEGYNIEGLPISFGPGTDVVEFPDGSGVAYGPRHRLVVQLHYHLDDPQQVGRADQTTIRMKFEDQVKRRAVFVIPDRFLASLGTPTPETLPFGQKAAAYEWTYSAKELGVVGVPFVDVLAVQPHMHYRGRRLEVQIGNAQNDDNQCIAKIDRWNFFWHSLYNYKDPPRLGANDVVKARCEFDTSADKTPVLPGWGTTNEMCLVVLMLALPPGL